MTGDIAPRDGGCNCGRIRYRLRREPLTCTICHCHRCQKRSGSAFSMSLVVPVEGVLLLAGEPARTERVTPSGAVNASFDCPACQSRLWSRREGGPTLNLRAGTLDEAAGIRPVAQFWTSSAQAWAVLPEAEVLTYPEQAADPAALRAAWRRLRAGQAAITP
ncbi:MAG: GFA family protein [Acetobacteraceae bacterium]|nr:GFA family protein [Acetobacteraceae bacterium]